MGRTWRCPAGAHLNTDTGAIPFDQFGVELGKRVASDVLPAVTGDGEYSGGNGSTRGLLDRIRKPGS